MRDLERGHDPEIPAVDYCVNQEGEYWRALVRIVKDDSSAPAFFFDCVDGLPGSALLGAMHKAESWLDRQRQSIARVREALHRE